MLVVISPMIFQKETTREPFIKLGVQRSWCSLDNCCELFSDRVRQEKLGASCRVRVPASGISGAEDKEKDQGVVVRRGLKVVRSKDAGRWTRTEYEGVKPPWGPRPFTGCGTLGASGHVTAKPSIRQ